VWPPRYEDIWSGCRAPPNEKPESVFERDRNVIVVRGQREECELEELDAFIGAVKKQYLQRTKTRKTQP